MSSHIKNLSLFERSLWSNRPCVDALFKKLVTAALS